MLKIFARVLAGSVCLAVTAIGSASAGGFDRGGVSIDQLFDPARISTEAGVTYVAPQRTLKNVSRLDGSGTTSSEVKVEGDYAVPRIGLKVNVVEPVDCLATYNEPYGADSSFGANNAYSPTAVDFTVDTRDIGLTCSYKVQVGKGFARLIGGLSYQEVEAFQSRQLLQTFAVPNGMGGFIVFNNPGIGTFQLSDEAFSWRIGAAYEIPEIALRGSIVYSAAYKYDGLSGTVDTTGFAVGPTNPIGPPGAALGVYPVTASTEVPQAIELKLQSGVAPGWLVFGSVKWQEWSKLRSIPINGVINPVSGALSTTVSFDPFYQDGWTISGGVGHAFTDTISGAASITWDRGTSTIAGYQSDLWTFGAGGSYKPTENVELRLGGAIGLWTSGSSGPTGADPANSLTYTFDNDVVYAGTASVKVSF